MRALSFILTVVLSTASFAQAVIVHVQPPGPTTATPIQAHLVLDVFGSGQKVTRDGSNIEITILDPSSVRTLPIQYRLDVPLPELLPAGEYRLTVFFDGDPQPQGTTEFVVRNAGPKPFDIHPFAVPTFGGGLRMRVSALPCGNVCGDVTVNVGGAEATGITRSADGSIWFTAPAHGEGVVDVTVTTGGVPLVSRAALYYFDDAEPSVFEPILFPLVSTEDGTNGSRWVSQATISNPKPWFVENATAVRILSPCVTYPCGERLQPGDFLRPAHGYPHGVVLWAPRPEAPDLAFALRLRDTSRTAENFGTRLPVVRERDFLHSSIITLPNVPSGPGSRVKLRIYAIDPHGNRPHFGRFNVRDAARGAVLNDLGFELKRACDSCADEPYYAEVDVDGGGATRLNLYVQMNVDAIGWAFATVTNTATQQVTIVTPDGSGNEQCDVCAAQ